MKQEASISLKVKGQKSKATLDLEASTFDQLATCNLQPPL